MAYLADLVGVGIVRLDDRLNVTIANHAAHLLLGRARGTMIGSTAIQAFLDFADRGGRGRGARERLRDERVRPPRDRRATRDRPRPRSPTSGVWLVIEDVSELRRLQQIRAEFIENLSHELRTPLTNVSLLVETLARGTSRRRRDGSAAHRRPDREDRGRDRSSRPDGQRDARPDEDRVGRPDRPARRRRSREAGRLGSRTASPLRRPPGRPAVGGCPRRRADRPRRRGTPRPGPRQPRAQRGEVQPRRRRRRDTRASRRRTRSSSSVEDHGVGIPKAALDRVFERFYKVDRARRRGQAAPASACRSLATSSGATAAGSGSSPTKARGRRSRSPSRPPRSRSSRSARPAPARQASITVASSSP